MFPIDDDDRGAAHPYFRNLKNHLQTEVDPDRIVVALPTARRGSVVLAASVTLFYGVPGAFFLALSIVNGSDWLVSHLKAVARETFGDRIRFGDTKVHSYNVIPDESLMRDVGRSGEPSTPIERSTQSTEPDPRITTNRYIVIVAVALWCFLAPFILFAAQDGSEEFSKNCSQPIAYSPTPEPIIKQVCNVPSSTESSQPSETEARVKVYK